MKIIKFRKISGNKYKLFLDNNESIILYEDVIIKNNLLSTKKIDSELLDDLMKQNNHFNVYDIALNYISVRMRSIYELRTYLEKKKVSDSLIENTVKKLLYDGYLNDLKFSKAFVNDKLSITNYGPLKIKKELLKYRVDEDIISSVIGSINQDVVKEKLKVLVNRQVKTKKGSANAVKNKLITYFVNLGYEKEMIVEELSKFEFNSDKEKLKKDYEKLYNKYKTKYHKNELLYFISQKLYLKGYTSDDIKFIINEKNNQDIS